MKHPFRFASALAALASLLVAAPALAEPWKFGVMSDTQWKSNLDGINPDTVAVGIINQLNQEFIAHDVKFVIQVGDLTDKSDSTYPTSLATRAAAAQPLYDAGIGFYPLRGNHESSQASTAWFSAAFPQTTAGGPHVFGATNFSSPFAALNGLSYSFDYNNARFVLLDQFTRTDGTNYLNSSTNNIIDQQGWIDTQLASRPSDSHAFVFSHKNLIGQNHADDLFGSNPAYDSYGNVAARNAFLASLQNNGVRYQFGGHDHMHHRAIITSPDTNARVQEIITSSNSYKFYIPQVPSNDEKYNVPAFGGPREIPIAQELFAIGYYIVTVDGPRVTVDHYAAPNGCNGDCDLTVTPALSGHFTKRETFGYSLNGKEFTVAQGQSYTAVQDSFRGTTARILDGTNASTGTDYAGRALTKAIDTGWTPREQHRHGRGHGHHDNRRRDADSDTASHILTLWGMADLGSSQTDVYTLSLTYDPDKARPEHLGRGLFGLAARDADGTWVNAVEMNAGGSAKFVKGAWKPGYGLGTYGIDPSTKTAWAVVNHQGDFAVTGFAETCRKK